MMCCSFEVSQQAPPPLLPGPGLTLAGVLNSKRASRCWLQGVLLVVLSWGMRSAAGVNAWFLETMLGLGVLGGYI